MGTANNLAQEQVSLDQMLTNQDKILLIEDSSYDAEIIRKTLGKKYHISNKPSLKEGIIFANDDIDLTILDLRLPDSDGIETFREFHNRFPHIPIVILSGSFNDLLVKQVLSEGAKSVISKDYIIDQDFLHQSISNALQSNHNNSNQGINKLIMNSNNHELLMSNIANIYTISDIMNEELFGPLGNKQYQDYAFELRECATKQINILSNMIKSIKSSKR